MSSETIKIKSHGPITTVILNRPEVRNAFNAEMIAALHACFTALNADSGCRAVILQGEGKAFCAGADLHWMKQMIHYTFDENVADAQALSRMLYALRTLSKPVIAKVHGGAYGGGVGLIAACDMAFASEETVFCLSETRLGLLPAVISPFVLEKIHLTHARRYAIAAETFSAAEAKRIGLLSDISSEGELDECIQRSVSAILQTGPEAVSACKTLLFDIAGKSIGSDWPEISQETAQRIAERRISPEGREGMQAFLEKRSPNWI